MAELDPYYILSTETGMIWCFSSYKTAGIAYVSAYEGEGTPFGSWSCDLMGCRKFRQELPGGRVSRSALRDAVQALLQQMQEAGVIENRDTL
jgi:hypothetical protein